MPFRNSAFEAGRLSVAQDLALLLRRRDASRAAAALSALVRGGVPTHLVAAATLRGPAASAAPGLWVRVLLEYAASRAMSATTVRALFGGPYVRRHAHATCFVTATGAATHTVAATTAATSGRTPTPSTGGTAAATSTACVGVPQTPTSPASMQVPAPALTLMPTRGLVLHAFPSPTSAAA